MQPHQWSTQCIKGGWGSDGQQIVTSTYFPVGLLTANGPSWTLASYFPGINVQGKKGTGWASPLPLWASPELSTICFHHHLACSRAGWMHWWPFVLMVPILSVVALCTIYSAALFIILQIYTLLYLSGRHSTWHKIHCHTGPIGLGHSWTTYWISASIVMQLQTKLMPYWLSNISKGCPEAWRGCVLPSWASERLLEITGRSA